MKSAPPLLLLATSLLSAPLAGCAGRAVLTNDVPHCEKLIPASLLQPVDHAPVPEAKQFADGHDDAQPWQEGFLIEGGQLDKANDRAPAVNQIYRGCLDLFRDATDRAIRKRFLGIF